MSDLKPCPFCGRIPVVEDCGTNRWFVRCGCGMAQDKLYHQRCDAVRAWNRRKSARPDTTAHTTDTISRQDAIDVLDAFKVMIENGESNPYSWARQRLTELSSAQPDPDMIHLQKEQAYMQGYEDGKQAAQPQRMRGKWVHDGYDHPHGVDWMHCSVCGRREAHVPAAMTNFCPNCGAWMSEESETEHTMEEFMYGQDLGSPEDGSL